MRHIPNILTFFRLAMVPCFLGASIEGMYGVAFVIFVTAAVTDIFDGMIARRLNVKSRLGALLDPTADKTLMVCGVLFYTLADGLPRVQIPAWLMFVVFIRDLLIAIFAYLMYTRIQIDRFPPSAAGKTSTVFQAIMIGAVIAANAYTPLLIPVAQFFFRASMVMTLFSGWGYLRRSALLLERRFAEQA